MKKSEKINYTLDLIEWISEYPGYWSIVCKTYGEEQVGLTAMMNTVKSLEKHGLYEMIVVFLTTHKDVPAIEGVKEHLLRKSFASKIKSGDGKQFIDELADWLK